MKFIHVTCQFLHHSGFFWFSEGTVRTPFRFSVFIQGDLNFDLPKKFSIELALSCFLDVLLHYKFHFLIVHSWVSVEVVADLYELSLIWLLPSASKTTSSFLILFVPLAHLPMGTRCSHPHRPYHHHHFGSESIAQRGGRIFTRIFSCSTGTSGLRFFVAWALFGDRFFASLASGFGCRIWRPLASSFTALVYLVCR